MEPVIRLEKLTKFYGTQRGAVDLDLEVRPGEIFGYLGPNGAGKTTTIRMLLDILRPTRGEAVVLGLDVRSNSAQIRRRVGYMPGDPILYGNLTGREYLTFVASIRGSIDWRLVASLAERFECDLTRRIDTLSHGNRQKIVVMQAFMHEPELLVLDEPTNGLDPLMQEEFQAVVGEVKAEGRTVFLSSHILPEAEELCDRVGIIRDGQIVAVEDVDALKAMRLRSLEIEFGGPVSPEHFASLEGVQNVRIDGSSLRCDIVGSLDPLFKAAARHEVLNVITQEPSLEEAFMTYYGRGENENAP
jgi:ABC-2 type transport system ATP-binding protein